MGPRRAHASLGTTYVFCKPLGGCAERRQSSDSAHRDVGMDRNH